MTTSTSGRTGIVARLVAGTAAATVAAGVVLATATAAHADDWTPPLTEPGQSGPSTSIEPPGSSHPAPAEPNGDAIHQDIMP